MVNCSLEADFTWAERIGSTCPYEAEYSPFQWNYFVSFIVVVVWFLIARLLFDGYYRLTGSLPNFSLAEHLTRRDNPALAVQVAAYFFSIGLVTRGSLISLPIDDDKLGEYFYTFFAYQTLGLAFMACVMLINDYLILRQIHNFTAIIQKHNVGVACVEGGSLIASAIVVAAAADGQYRTSEINPAGEAITSTDFGLGVLATLVYWALGQTLLISYVLLHGWLYSMDIDISNVAIVHTLYMEQEAEVEMTSASASDAPPAAPEAPLAPSARPQSMLSQIEANGNPAAGLSLAFDLVVAGVAIRTPIRAGYSLMTMAIWVPSVLLVALPLIHVYMDVIILRATNYRHNVIHKRNWGAALLLGSLKLLVVLLLDTIYQTNCATHAYIDHGLCEEPKYPNSLGGRLAVSAIPDVLRWQAPLALVLLLLLLLAIKLLVRLRFALLSSSFSLDDSLADASTSATAIVFAGHSFGQGLVLVGVATCADADVGRHAADLFGWTAIGCVLMLVSQLLNDKLIVRGLSNAQALLDDNVAVAMMEAGQSVATGVVIHATMVGGGTDFAEALGSTLIFWVLSQVLLLLFTAVYRKMTVFDDLEQIKSGNVAAGLGGAMTLVSLALGMAYPIRQYGSIAVFVPVALTGFALLVALRRVLDWLILPGDKLDDEILQVNWGAALIEGALACAIGLITNTYIKQRPDFDVCA